MSEEEPMVYCLDCGFSGIEKMSSGRGYYDKEVCNHPGNWHTIHTPTHHHTSRKAEIAKLNKNNDCLWYEDKPPKVGFFERLFKCRR